MEDMDLVVRQQLQSVEVNPESPNLPMSVAMGFAVGDGPEGRGSIALEPGRGRVLRASVFVLARKHTRYGVGAGGNRRRGDHARPTCC